MFATFMTGFEWAMARAAEQFGISTALILCFLHHLSVDEAWDTWRDALPYVQRGSILGVGLDSTEELGNPNEQCMPLF